MIAKGDSNKESKNRTPQMQVRQEVEKIRGWTPPALLRVQTEGVELSLHGRKGHVVPFGQHL